MAGMRDAGKRRTIQAEGSQVLVAVLVTALLVVCATVLLWILKDIGTYPQVMVIPIGDGAALQEVTVEAWRPVELRFKRTAAFEPCGSLVLTDDLGLSRRLVLSDKASFSFTPAWTGTFVYSCPMHCMHGVIRVKEPA